MNVVLIGGTGNISSDCALELVRKGHQVYAVTRGNRTAPPGVTPLTADRRNAVELSGALKGIAIDTVIDFLGFTPDDMQIDLDVLTGRSDQLIFISSATVYSKPHVAIPITEDHPVGNPFSPYAQRKEACEKLLRSQDDLPVTIVRPSHTYCHKWIPNPVSSAGYTVVDRLEQRLPVFVAGTGDNPWTITSTTDFAKGLTGLVGCQQAIGETFHITSDEHHSWKEIYGLIACAAGTDAPDIVEIPVDFICSSFPQLTANIRGDKSEPAVFDNSRIKSLVPGFECTKSALDGLKESVAWMRSHPEDKLIRSSVNETFDKVISAWRKHQQR